MPVSESSENPCRFLMFMSDWHSANSQSGGIPLVIKLTPHGTFEEHAGAAARSTLMKKSVKKQWFYKCHQWTPNGHSMGET